MQPYSSFRIASDLLMTPEESGTVEECSARDSTSTVCKPGRVALDRTRKDSLRPQTSLLLTVVAAHELLRHKTSLPFLYLIACVFDQL